MTARVVDTNVVLVANQDHPDVSPECVIACVKLLAGIMEQGRLVIDDQYRILREYQLKTLPSKGKGVGDVFVKWALSHQRTPAKVETVELTELSPGMFAEFPDAELQAAFDPDDRKFAAVSHAHPDKPPVCQAVDCKWIDWWPTLSAHGVSVEFPCEEDICRFYSSKFPGRRCPALP